MTVVLPILIGLAYVTLSSLIPVAHRQRFNAILVAGAGGVYFSSGAMGPWEIVFGAAAIYAAFRGLKSWTWIGIGWFLHTGWDIVHHIKGAPILPFAHDSSLGCAICDPVIAIWCFAGGPSVFDLVKGQASLARTSSASG